MLSASAAMVLASDKDKPTATMSGNLPSNIEMRETIAELATKEHKERKDFKIKAFSLCFLRSLVAFAIFAITSRVPALLGCFIRLDELNAVMMPHAMHLEFDLIANLMVEQSLGHG